MLPASIWWSAMLRYAELKNDNMTLVSEYFFIKGLYMPPATDHLYY